MEAALGSILSDHFDNSQNPHETIYRIWLLLNVGALPRSEVSGAVMDALNVSEPTYN
ncbi:MAG: hypothetical protein V4517_24730 [Pseudomonadota bacterium]